MPPKMLNVLLVVQALFAGSLLYIGYTSRENRKQDYLELTHRVTAGQASAADFQKLAGFLPDWGGKPEVRALFGLPVTRATQLELKDAKPITGEYWVYYTPRQVGPIEMPLTPVDSADVEKLQGSVACFVVEFDKKGRAKPRMENVVHPIK